MANMYWYIVYLNCHCERSNCEFCKAAFLRAIASFLAMTFFLPLFSLWSVFSPHHYAYLINAYSLCFRAIASFLAMTLVTKFFNYINCVLHIIKRDIRHNAMTEVEYKSVLAFHPVE